MINLDLHGRHLKWGLTIQEHRARDKWFEEAGIYSANKGICTCYRAKIYYKFNVEYFSGGVRGDVVTIGCDGCGAHTILTKGPRGSNHTY